MLEKVKEYLRVDGDHEDQQIEALISAANKYLVNAGAIKDDDNNLYMLAVKILVTHWYENRLPVGNVTTEMAFSLRHILTQLRYCYSDEEAD